MSPSGSDRLGEGFLLVQVGCSLALWQSKLCLFAFFGFSLFCFFAVFFLFFLFCAAGAAFLSFLTCWTGT